MGRAMDRRAQFHKQIANGHFEMAMSMCRDMPLDLGEALDLTVLGGKVKSPLFDPMGVKWIRLVDDAGKLTLREVQYLAETLQAIPSGDASAAAKLDRFLARGSR